MSSPAAVTTEGGFTPSFGATVTYSGGSIAAGGSATFVFTAVIDDSLTGAIIDNTATVTQATTLPGADPNERDEPDVDDNDTVTVPVDFGDLPDTYDTTSGEGGAGHVISGTLRLGSGVDAETDGAPSGDATGDTGDEDGIDRSNVPFDNWQPGNTATITATVNGSGGHLVGWFDWNNDGVFGPGEIINFGAVSDGDNALNVPIDGGYTTGNPLAVRFRLYDGDPGSPTPGGIAVGGEVEDYVWQFSPTAISLLNFNSAGSPVAPGYFIWLLLLLLSTSWLMLKALRFKK